MASWFKGVISNAENDDSQSVTVHRRTISDYADDVQNGQRRVELKLRELEQARQQLGEAQQAFIAHVAELGLPFEVEPTQWPARAYKLED